MTRCQRGWARSQSSCSTGVGNSGSRLGSWQLAVGSRQITIIITIIMKTVAATRQCDKVAVSVPVTLTTVPPSPFLIASTWLEACGELCLCWAYSERVKRRLTLGWLQGSSGGGKGGGRGYSAGHKLHNEMKNVWQGEPSWSYLA